MIHNCIERFMGTLLLTLLWSAGLVGCTALSEQVYNESLVQLRVEVEYPEGYDHYCRAGVAVVAEEIYSSSRYAVATDAFGVAEFCLTKGFYRISVADNADDAIFNGMSDRVRLTEGDMTLPLLLTFSRPGQIIIKEIYSGGCSKAPYEGYYQSDRYFILHNNSAETEYLDGLCFGTLDPYNSNAPAGNVWATTDPETGATLFREYAPVVEAVWALPGSGQEFPLQPGEEAIVALNGAIDHTLQYPESVNLNREECFVCYNPTLYPNISYHPAPGDRISPERYCEVLLKVGKSNGYIISNGSPTLILFRAPEEIDMVAYLEDRANSTVTKPGSTEICVKIPWDWVLDGVEVYNGAASNNVKRLPDSVDAGFVFLSGTAMGHTLYRHLDEKASAAAGYEIYCDTNNSSSDFYERDEQSLNAL